MPYLESEGVLLESQDGIARLLLTLTPRREKGGCAAAPRPLSRTDAPIQSQPAKSLVRNEPSEARPARSRRCTCGICQRCLDNARWERIFNEKFADPSYYGGISVRHHSSLAGFF